MKINEESILSLKKKFESSSASVIITDNKGKIEYVNTQFEKVTGYSADEVRGENPRILKSGKTTPDKYKNLWKIILKGQNWSGEFENKKKNGEPFWEYSTIYPILNEDNKIAHFLAIKEDITAIKKVDKEIKKEKLKRKLSVVLKYNFLNRLSHEIRTPVNIMVSFADMFSEYQSSNKNHDFPPYLATLNDLNNGIVNTIDLLLYLSENKPEKNKTKLKLLTPDFIDDLVNSIKIPTQTIMGIGIALKSKCNCKEDDLKTLFKIMLASCNRVITTINIVVENSEKTDDEIKFIKCVTDRINSVKESYKGEANKKIFHLPSSNLSKRIENEISIEKNSDQLYSSFDNKVKENEWIEDLISSNESSVAENKLNKTTDQKRTSNEEYRSLYNLDKNKMIELKIMDDVYVVFIKYNKVDYSVTRSFEKFLKKNLVEVKNKIIFDFVSCKKIDTCFWGLLVKFVKEHKFEPSNISLVLNYRDQPNTFISSHMDEIFHVFNNLQEAINSAKVVNKASNN